MADQSSSLWSGRNVLITGTSGFLGSWLTKFLVDNKANVFAFDYRMSKFSNFSYFRLETKVKKIIEGSITDLDLVKKIFRENNIDTCFHLAAQPIVGLGLESAIPTFETNIKGTWNILEVCRMTESVRRVVVTSSDKAYGEHKDLPYREEFALRPADPYSTSKACTDLIAQTFGKIYKMPIGITRCANIYGGGDFHFSRIVPSVAKSIVLNKNPKLTSDGTPVRDLIFILDAVSAYITLAEQVHQDKVKGEAFNFSGEIPMTILDLVKKMILISGKKLKPEIMQTREQGKEIDEQYLSCEKAKKILKWKPKVSLDDGIKETLNWYGNFFNSEFYKKDPANFSSI